MVKRIFPLSIILFLIVFVASYPALAAGVSGDGKISGALINGTVGSSSDVTNQSVTLNVYQGAAQVDQKSSKSDASGKYLFENLSTDPSYSYEIEVSYQGAQYFSDPLQFAAGETSKTADVVVNDTTSSDEGVSIMLAHAVLTKDANSLNVVQYYYFANTLDRAYIGKPGVTGGNKNETLKLALPPGATNFAINYGLKDLDLIKNGNNIIDTAPLTPAGREISISYQIPVSVDQIAWTFNYAVSRFDILTSDPTMKLSGDKLTAEQSLNISGKNYQDYSGSDIAAGQTITAEVSNAGGFSFNSLSWNWLILIPILAVLAVISIILTRRRKNQPMPVATSSNSDLDIKEKLLSEIAALDDRFEGGKIEEKEYNRLRSEKKRKLVTLIQILEEPNSSKE